MVIVTACLTGVCVCVCVCLSLAHSSYTMLLFLWQLLALLLIGYHRTDDRQGAEVPPLVEVQDLLSSKGEETG